MAEQGPFTYLTEHKINRDYKFQCSWARCLVCSTEGFIHRRSNR